jgi:2-iminobutanoate/2-iminopropanoate deaminase
MATIFMTNMNDFSQMNEVYREFFAEDFPARVTTGVARLASNYSIEIVVVAAR